MPLTKKEDLAGAIALKTGLTKKKGMEVVEALSDVLREELAKPDGEVGILGIFTMKTKHIPSKLVHNPATGEMMNSRAKNTVKFKPGTRLLQAMNQA